MALYDSGLIIVSLIKLQNTQFCGHSFQPGTSFGVEYRILFIRIRELTGWYSEILFRIEQPWKTEGSSGL